MPSELRTETPGVLPVSFVCYGPRQVELASLLSMIQLNAGTLMPDLTYLGAVAKTLAFGSDHVLVAAGASVSLPLAERAHALKAMERLTEFASGAGLVAAAGAGKRAFDTCLENLSSDRPTPNQLQRAASQLESFLTVFSDEVGARRVFALGRDAGEQLDAGSKLFGDEVEDAFTSAKIDIAEAGACLALERWTAAVMHVMRVHEVALAELAKRVGVEPGENWNRTLNEIESGLRAVTRKLDGAEEEQWAAEAAAHLRSIKNAWRNHAMHSRTQYGERAALAIVDEARTFLQHLAKKLRED